MFYPCPYTDSTPALYQDTMDLNDIFNFEDVMITSIDEDIPALDDVIGLWNQQTMVSIKTFISPLNRTYTYQIVYHYTYLLYLTGICIHIGYLLY